MKTPLKFLAALFAACFFTLAAFAADASPTGTWKWMQPGRNGGQGSERKVKLELKDGKLTGTMLGYEGPGGAVPDTAIGDGTFKDGVVAFTIKRDFNGNSFVVKYSGKLDGDTIKGESEVTFGENVRKNEWEAKRDK